jgi:hypothetical protein
VIGTHSSHQGDIYLQTAETRTAGIQA